MKSRSSIGTKFLLISASSVLGLGVVASFVVPTANAAPSVAPTAVVVTSAVPEAPSTEAPSTEVGGINCNNGLDATGAQCDGGSAANPNDGGVDSQSGTDTSSEVASGIDGDNIQN